MVKVILSALLTMTMCTACGDKTSKCTICGKEATHKFKGYGHCDTHYKDAIIWAMQHTN